MSFQVGDRVRWGRRRRAIWRVIEVDAEFTRKDFNGVVHRETGRIVIRFGGPETGLVRYVKPSWIQKV